MRHPGQPWLQITISHDAPEQVEAILEAEGALAITLRDGADEALLQPVPGATPLWRSTEVIGLFAADNDAEAIIQAVQHGLNAPAAPEWHAELIEDRDWIRAWLDDYHPIRFGQNLWVCPRHESVDAADAIVLHLDPGLAFGTGAHASTGLCLEWLEAHPPQGHTVIDYGCGSGILAIAAVLLGAHQAYAVDIDPQALTATRENAAANEVAARVEICTATALPRGTADLLIANILAGPLIALAPEFSELIQPPATLVMAGLLESQVESVKNAYAETFVFEAARVRDGWACLIAQRREH